MASDAAPPCDGESGCDEDVSVCVCVRQLAELQADSEDVQRSLQQLRKKCQKMTAELQDTKLHLEGLQSRNHELEKKQRKSVPVSSTPAPPTTTVTIASSHNFTARLAPPPWHTHSDPLGRTLMFSFHLSGDSNVPVICRIALAGK